MKAGGGTQFERRERGPGQTLLDFGPTSIGSLQRVLSNRVTGSGLSFQDNLSLTVAGGIEGREVHVEAVWFSGKGR